MFKKECNSSSHIPKEIDQVFDYSLNNLNQMENATEIFNSIIDKCGGPQKLDNRLSSEVYPN